MASRKRTVRDAADAWRDPEGPARVLPGLGCARCHIRPPLVKGLPFGALCDACLEATMAPWGWERIAVWLGRQREVWVRQEKRRAALAAYRNKLDRRLADAYRAEYGVDLIAYAAR